MKKLVILLCIVILSFACVSCDLKELSDIDNEIRDALNITNPEDKIRQIHKLEMKIELLSDFERGLLVNYDRLLSEKDKVVLDFKNSLSWGDQLKKDVSYYTLSDLIDFNEIEILAFGHNQFPSAFLYVENEEYISEVLNCLNDVPFAEVREDGYIKSNLYEHYIGFGKGLTRFNIVNGGFVELIYEGEDKYKVFFSLIKLDDSYKEILSGKNIYDNSQYGNQSKKSNKNK